MRDHGPRCTAEPGHDYDCATASLVRSAQRLQAKVGPFMDGYDALKAERNTLRAQLAAAEEKNRELEEQHAHDCDQFNRLAQEKADAEKERDAANERVKARHG